MAGHYNKIDAIRRRIEYRKTEVKDTIAEINDLLEREEFDLAASRCHNLLAYCQGLRDDSNMLADLDE